MQGGSAMAEEKAPVDEKALKADKQPQAEARRVQVDLSGQVAIVTGASQGIGRAIAEVLAANGATVALVARSAGKLADVAAGIRAAGGSAEEFPCDVSQAAAVQAVVDAIHAKLGRIDILVNNAGVTRDTLLPRMSDEEWDEVLTTNLRGPFLFMRAASRPMMQQRYGRIVNVASVSGLIGNPGQANYSASKAGLVGLTRTVAKELAGRKITVNAVAPGFIASDMTAALGPALLDEVKKRVPAKRLGEAWEIAEAVLFLAAPSSGYITAQVLTIDGGLIG
ncbi:MAG: 3-oxoacyl-[acyl-carrier-protein] reductase [Planctomycetia bacterium]